MAEEKRQFRVTLLVESATPPEDWFWTDACPSPDDDVILEHHEEVDDGS